MKKIWLINLGLFLFASSLSQTYSYDNNHQITKIKYNNNITVSIQYDANGNIINTTTISGICPGTQGSFYAGTNNVVNTTYQWEVNQGSGFVTVSNNANYSGATTPILQLNNTPSSWYGYTYRCLINGPGGSSYSDIVTLKFATTWLGGNSIAWEDPLNWSCSGVPDANMDVIINGNLDYLPTVNSSASCRNLLIGQNTVLNLLTNQLLNVKGNVTNTGSIKGPGIVVLNGSSLQTINGNGFINNLTINNSVGAVIANGVENMQSLFGTLTLTNGQLATNGNLTLKSNDITTARVATITGGSIVGNVTVERYIPATGRKYRLLTPTVNTTGSINTNWQEGQMNTAVGTNINLIPGFGTQITGTGGNANGFDVTQSNAPSLYAVTNGITPGYIAVGNTSGTLNALTGYFLFIRGDRSTNMTLANTNVPPNPIPLPSSSTTLRATGTIKTGTITTFTNPMVGGGALNLITNPYPSPIDWSLMQPACSNITQFYTLWDPHIGYRGGFVTVKTDGTVSNAGSLANTFIQSGQAFFVESNGGVPAISIQETHKTDGNNNGVYLTGTLPQESFSASLFYREANYNRVIADGVTAIYDNSYSPLVDANDANEVGNWDENIAISRSGHHLSIEARPVIVQRDTLPLFINNMKQMAYELEFKASNFSNPGLIATLIDSFTNIKTPLSVTGVTVVPFSVNSTPASYSPNRFTVIFGAPDPLAVSEIIPNAYQKNKGIQVDWITKTESDMDHYEVEKSANGTQFNKVASQVSLGNNGSSTSYGWFDAAPFTGLNFYRIKAIDKSGQIQYSKIVKVNIEKEAEAITIYPNPTNNNNFNIKLTNIPKGIYTITMINNLGQQVLTTQLNHAGGTIIYNIEMRSDLARGIYDVIINGTNLKKIIKFQRN